MRKVSCRRSFWNTTASVAVGAGESGYNSSVSRGPEILEVVPLRRVQRGNDKVLLC